MCYKSHLIISKCHSTDADLELINDLSKQLSSFTVGSEKDVADNALNATALKVAKLLLVILLPTIKDVLMSYVHKYSTEHSADLTTTKQSITSRWILSHLTVNLKHHYCIQVHNTKEYGTLVYRPNTDFQQPIMTLEPLLENYGWSITDNELTIKLWDTATNVQVVRDQVLKGCKCSTGCLTGRCGCKKRGKHCLIGCECLNCGNNI